MKPIAPGPPAGKAAPSLQVLYVEDELANWEVAELRLRSKYDLRWAKSDAEACEAVQKAGERLHAILMDVQLKGSTLDGLQLTRLFRGKLPLADQPSYARGLPVLSCPIFFVTAYGNLHSPIEMDAAGGNGHVPKPIDFFKLTLLLANASARRAIETLKR